MAFDDRQATLISGIVNELLSGSGRTKEVLPSLSERVPSGCCPTVSMGLPWLDSSASDTWIGRRLILFSHPIPSGKRLTLLSSRIGRRLDLESWWFDLLRTAVLQCHSDNELLVTAEGTSTCAAVTRAAELFSKPRLHFRPVGSDELKRTEQVVTWLGRALEVLAEQFARSSDDSVIAYVSPMIQIDPTVVDTSTEHRSLDVQSAPLADRLQLAAADRAYVIGLRNDGFTHSLVARLLREDSPPAATLLIASDEHGALPKATEQLPNGWVAWLVEPHSESVVSSAAQSTPIIINGYAIPCPRRRRINRPSKSNPLSEPAEWLLHWTRPATGPWPNETADDYLDSLILRTDSADRSSLATLLRIISDGRIISSNKGIRGAYQVVSLTAVPLHEFPTRRAFRKHLHRFDFEPWGIAIRKSALANNVRAVIYGDDSTWQTLSETDRPFFQKATFGGATNNVAEQEWRVTGDLLLNTHKRQDICIFVPNSEAAELVSQHCDLGVVVVPA